MYILTNDPPGGLRKEAFDALDDAFGTGEFSQGQAETVLANSIDTSAPESVFRDLVSNGYVTEVE